MPNCFRLYATSPEAINFHMRHVEPVILQKVDEHICQHFNVDVHPKYWCGDWYHVTGFLIALRGFPLGSRDLRLAVVKWYVGDTLRPKAEQREYLRDQLLILKFLEKHYRSDNWVEIGRR